MEDIEFQAEEEEEVSYAREEKSSRSRKRRRTEGKGWKGFENWLGTGNVVGGKEQTYRSFESCRAFARGLGLRSQTEWKTWSRDSGKRPANVPSAPDRVYKGKGWKGFGDWLGTGNVKGGKKKTYRSFESCKIGRASCRERV